MKVTTNNRSLAAAILVSLFGLLLVWLCRDSFLIEEERRYDAAAGQEERVLAPDEEIELSFVAERTDIRRIYLYFLDGRADEGGTIHIRLLGPDQGILAERSIPMEEAVDQYVEEFILTEEQNESIQKGDVCRILVKWTGAAHPKEDRIRIYKELPVVYGRYNEKPLAAAVLLSLACGFILAVKIETDHKIIRRILLGGSILFSLLLPVFAYVLFEYITGNLPYITGLKCILNILFFYAFYLVIFLLTNRLRFTNLFTTIALALIAAAEYFVVLFRGRPIMVWDVLAVGTAATVAGNYTYTITSHLVLAILALTAAMSAASKVTFRIRRLRIRLAAAGVGAAALACYLYTFYNVAMTKYDLAINMWDPASSYADSGYVLCTFVYLDYMMVEKPDGYSPEAVREIMDAQEERESPKEDAVTPVNLICIMNESLCDLRVIGDFQTSQEFLPFLDSLTENTVKGNLYMPVFGSMTCNSEYEFLTGNNMAFLPSGSVAYQVYVKPDTYSIVSTLKAEGYRAVAMHPYPAANWNRDRVFQYLGFDEFLAEEAFEDSERLRDYVSDKGTYDKIIELVEEKEEGEKLFLFDVTMQNHGGYDMYYENFSEDVFLTGYSGYPKTDQYLSLVKKSDEAFEYLVNYFSGVEEPTMIVMFGDHQPSIETGFYEQVYGKAYEDWGLAEQLKRFITPFVIWTNYESGEAAYYEQLSAHYLSTLMLDRANIPLTDFHVFLRNTMDRLPVVHPIGYVLPDGTATDWSGWRNSEYYPLFHQIELVEYNSVLDYGKRVDSVYAPKGGGSLRSP